MTLMTLTTRVTRRRSGPTSAVWLSSHPSNWTHPLRYWILFAFSMFGAGLLVPTLCILASKHPSPFGSSAV